MKENGLYAKAGVRRPTGRFWPSSFIGRFRRRRLLARVLSVFLAFVLLSSSVTNVAFAEAIVPDGRTETTVTQSGDTTQVQTGTLINDTALCHRRN